MLPGKIFGLFYMYGLMIAIGILIAIGLLFYYGKKKKIEEKFIDFVFYDAIISIIFFTEISISSWVPAECECGKNKYGFRIPYLR